MDEDPASKAAAGKTVASSILAASACIICPNCCQEAPGGLYHYNRGEYPPYEEPEGILHCGCFYDSVKKYPMQVIFGED